MKHQTNPGDQKCKSMRKLAGRTLIDILPPKVFSRFYFQWRSTFFCGNLYNAVISTLADRLPGRQVWRSQQGKFRWCYQWISKSNCYNLVFMVTWISPIKRHQSGSRLLRHGWTVELLRQDPRHPRVIPFPKSNPLRFINFPMTDTKAKDPNRVLRQILLLSQIQK